MFPEKEYVHWNGLVYLCDYNLIFYGFMNVVYDCSSQ